VICPDHTASLRTDEIDKVVDFVRRGMTSAGNRMLSSGRIIDKSVDARARSLH